MLDLLESKFVVEEVKDVADGASGVSTSVFVTIRGNVGGFAVVNMRV